MSAAILVVVITALLITTASLCAFLALRVYRRLVINLKESQTAQQAVTKALIRVEQLLEEQRVARSDSGENRLSELWRDPPDVDLDDYLSRDTLLVTRKPVRYLNALKSVLENCEGGDKSTREYALRIKFARSFAPSHVSVVIPRSLWNTNTSHYNNYELIEEEERVAAGSY